jgi:hypothetical protein
VYGASCVPSAPRRAWARVTADRGDNCRSSGPTVWRGLEKRFVCSVFRLSRVQEDVVEGAARCRARKGAADPGSPPAGLRDSRETAVCARNQRLQDPARRRRAFQRHAGGSEPAVRHARRDMENRLKELRYGVAMNPHEAMRPRPRCRAQGGRVEATTSEGAINSPLQATQ